MNTSHYIPQTPGYKSMIHSIWQVDGFTSFREEQIIPKGVVEIIFNFSDNTATPVKFGSRQYDLSRCFINGFNTVPVRLRLPKQQVFFGVTLQPMAVKKIFKTPAGAFADSTVDLTLLDANFHSLWHLLAEQNSFDKRVTVFTNWLNSHCIDLQPQEHLVNDFLYAANQHDVSVTALARSLCYSPRHLSRKLFEATGMNTEEILLYKKYLHAVHLVHHTDLSLTAIAYQSHFSDQSHFIRSFKAFTAMTPGAYKRNKGYVKGHLYANVR